MNQYKPRGYWIDWKNVEKELKAVIQKNVGRIPTYKEFLELGRSDLSHAIQRHHGGINGIRRKLGIRQFTKRKNGMYKDLSTIIQEINEIIYKHRELNGNLPSAWWLQQNGYHTLYQAIRIHHGGFRQFRKTIGKEQISLENGTWKSLEFVLNEMKRIMENHELENPPGQWTLKKLGYGSICYSIQKYHRGFRAFKEKLRDYLGQPPENKQLESMLEGYAGGETK